MVDQATSPFLAELDADILRIEGLVTQHGNDIDRAILSIYLRQRVAYLQGVTDERARGQELVVWAADVMSGLQYLDLPTWGPRAMDHYPLKGFGLERLLTNGGAALAAVKETAGG